MSNSPITVRFTDENYSTRLEVARTLGTNLIDPIWNEILKYRSTMKHIFNVFDITHQQFFITLTNRNNEKITSISGLFSRFNKDFDGIVGGDLDKEKIVEDGIFTSIRSIAHINNLEINSDSFKSILNGFDSSILGRYYTAIKELGNQKYEQINEEMFAKYLMILRGENELTSFYRLNDVENESSRYLISREYDAAPAHDIEALMSNLCKFLEDNNESLLLKMIVTIYMFEYIKPFEKYNCEMCGLILKRLASNNGVYYFVPFELAFIDQIRIKTVGKEIQKTRDVTYLFLPLADQIERSLLKLLDQVVQVSGHNVKQAYIAGDDKEEFKKEFGFTPKEEVLAPKVEFVAPKVEKPVEVSPKLEEKKEAAAEKPVSDTPKVEKREKIETSSDEKELKRQAKELLESDPYLKKGQAHFYVRHNIKGRYYSIQEYKKCEGCVYETARTSMDNLAKLGYYRREQIKNKFVYTPTDK